MHQKILLETSIKQEGRFLLTHRMEQALQILQLPRLDLQDLIQQELEKNPLLERKEQKTVSIDPSFLPEKKSLFSSLEEQIHYLFSSKDLPIAQEIIKHIDRKGYLSVSLEELSTHLQKDLILLEKILLQIHKKMEPAGIGSRSLQECLFLQIKRKSPRSLEEKIIKTQFSNLLHHRFALIQKELKITKEELQVSIQKISSLSLHPGGSFFEELAPSRFPDIVLKKRKNTWHISIHQEEIFTLPISSYLSKDKEEKKQMHDWISSGKWLMQSLTRRKDLLLKLTIYLVKKQNAFFEGTGNLQPIHMKEAAEELGMHESTISRAVYEKYIDCPKGIFSIRSFFTYSLRTSSGKTSNAFALQTLQKLVAEEKKAFSDNDLSQKLKDRGVYCSRRTITKYRKKLKIPSSIRRNWTKSTPL
ncbi:MAG: RNA polymerase factor sigma-54 [Chlamydiota bacterium]